MTRIEMLNKMKELEERKIDLEMLLIDLSSSYLNSVDLQCKIDTRAFERQYMGGRIQVTPARLIKLVKEEINSLESEIWGLIERLK